MTDQKTMTLPELRKFDGQLFIQNNTPMQITFHEGRALRDVQVLGKQDPYVKVKIAKKELKIKEHNNGDKNPKWSALGPPR